MAIDPDKTFTPINIAVLTVSDTRTAENDTSGDILAARITDAGHNLAARLIIKDDANLLASKFASSFMIRRAARLCPASVMRAARISPEVSFSAVRVSDTVRTAILIGVNVLSGSIAIHVLLRPSSVAPGKANRIGTAAFREFWPKALRQRLSTF